jgi:hypothetical protein
MAAMTTGLRQACEDGSFCHDMAYAIADERDLLKRALLVAIRAQGEQFTLRELAECEEATFRAFCKEHRIYRASVHILHEATEFKCEVLGGSPDGKTWDFRIEVSGDCPADVRTKAMAAIMERTAK